MLLNGIIFIVHEKNLFRSDRLKYYQIIDFEKNRVLPDQCSFGSLNVRYKVSFFILIVTPNQ